MKELDRNLILKTVVLLGMLFLLACRTGTQNVRDGQPLAPPLPPVALSPIALEGNSMLDNQTVHCEKEGKAAEASLWRQGPPKVEGVYILKLRIINLNPSILDVNPKQVFCRRTNEGDVFNTVTGADLIDIIRNKASQDYTQSLRDKATYDSVTYGAIAGNQGGLAIAGFLLSKRKEREASKNLELSSQYEDLARKNMLFFSQLPRGGSVEGLVLFFPKINPLSTEDDLTVQFYLGGEEFVFRFVEATKILSPNSEN